MASGFDWQQVYPKSKIITLVLNANEADRLMKAAVSEDRKIASGVILGMPSIEFGVAQLEVGKANSPADEDLDKPQLPISNTNDDTRPSAEIVILPCVRREPMQPKKQRSKADQQMVTVSKNSRSILDERPPQNIAVERQPQKIWNKHRGQFVFAGEITKADRQMVADAIASGFPVTKCPPRQYSVPAGQPDAGMGVWSKRKTRRQRVNALIASRKNEPRPLLENEADQENFASKLAGAGGCSPLQTTG